jgi:hypothetical protein
MEDLSSIGELPESGLGRALANKIQAARAWSILGLRCRALAVWTFQCTAGTANAANTFDLTVGGTSILGGAIESLGDTSDDAEAIALAVNTQTLTTGLIATVSTDTVTIRQAAEGGTLTITKIVTGDAAGTLTETNAGTASWTTVNSGDTFDGDLYYQLGWSGALMLPIFANARLVDIKLMTAAQDFMLWSGGMRAASDASAILDGDDIDAATWTDRLPWMDAEVPLVIKLDADDPLTYKARLI